MITASRCQQFLGTVVAMEITPLYTEPGFMTTAGPFAPLLRALPDGIPGLAAVVQGLLIHEHMAENYGVTLTDADRASVHIRPVSELLAQIVARDGRPLPIARVPGARLPVNCRHFTVMMTAMLRANGTPARARCGFGGYFGTGAFEDHWVCEYWDSSGQRWSLVDAQIDDRQRGWFDIDFDLTDVPRDRVLTETPDASHAELDRLMGSDERLRVPEKVRSAARDRHEPVFAPAP
jgi:Transglutaminase-like superfamily